MLVIEDKIADLKASMPVSKSTPDCIDVKNLLSSLLHTDIWSKNEKDHLLSFFHKVDISSEILTHYRLDWEKPKQVRTLEESWFSIVSLLLVKLLTNERTRGVDHSILLKRMNTLFKLMDKAKEPWIKKGAK
jgi:hypothetical protein